MSIRFRRRIKLGKGIGLNLGKKSAGLSLGGRGARLGVSTRGIYRSFSIPGTGLYSIDYLNKGNTKDKRKDIEGEEGDKQSEARKDPLPLPEELRDFNYPPFILVFGISLLPFQIFMSLVLIGLYFYTSRRLASTPKGKARKEFHKGKKALENGDFRSALVSFRQVLKEYEIKELYPIVAQLLLRESEYEEAVKYYEKYLEFDPSDRGSKLNYAISLKIIEDYDKAIDILQELLKEIQNEDDDKVSEEERLRIISTLGGCFLKKKQPDLALEILKSGPVRARKLDNVERLYYKYMLGLAYMEDGEEDRALTHLKRVYAHDKDFMQAEELVNRLEKGDKMQA